MTELTEIPSDKPPLMTHSQHWMWLAIFLSVAICAAVSVIHVQQRQTLRLGLSELESIRQARIDLGMGFLHISMAREQDSPFGRPEGLALLKQAIASFEQGLLRLGLNESEHGRQFRASVENFERELNSWQNTGHEPTSSAELRISFSQLEKQAGKIDIDALIRLRKLSDSLDYKFGLTLLVSTILLAVICLIVFMTGKISDRYAAASQASEKQFKAMFDVAAVGIVQIDPQVGKILRFNQKFAEIAGYTADELLNIKVFELTHPDDRQRDMEIFSRAMRGETPDYRNEKRYLRKDGSTIWVRLNASFIRDESGRAIRTVAICEDISEQKKAAAEQDKLQMQLNQAQKMEAVGRLAGGVAHDFNNMLGVIIGHAEIALEQLKPDHPLHENIHEIRLAGERSTDLTRQLLAFARSQTISPKIIDLNKTVEAMLKMLRRLIGEEIDLAWRPHDDLWPIKMDPSQIDQLLANLCVNARDAISHTGKVTIETENVVFDAEYCANNPTFIEGEFVRLAVSDDGCGMDKETLHRLFEPFFTTKGPGKGTGLGLSTVYGIVKQNHGFINVYSEPGKGTTFKIYLARHVSGEIQAMAEKAPAESARGTETILVVEDDQAIRKLTVSMLVKQGYNVLSAGKPGDALKIAKEYQGRIHLLLTDVVMPEMNGNELVNELTKTCPQIKRLFMSGYTANVIVHHGVLDEGVHFIQKPFSLLSLSSKVRGILDMKDEA